MPERRAGRHARLARHLAHRQRVHALFVDERDRGLKQRLDQIAVVIAGSFRGCGRSRRHGPTPVTPPRPCKHRLDSLDPRPESCNQRLHVRQAGGDARILVERLAADGPGGAGRGGDGRSRDGKRARSGGRRAAGDPADGAHFAAAVSHRLHRLGAGAAGPFGVHPLAAREPPLPGRRLRHLAFRPPGGDRDAGAAGLCRVPATDQRRELRRRRPCLSADRADDDHLVRPHRRADRAPRLGVAAHRRALVHLVLVRAELRQAGAARHRLSGPGRPASGGAGGPPAGRAQAGDRPRRRGGRTRARPLSGRGRLRGCNPPRAPRDGRVTPYERARRRLAGGAAAAPAAPRTSSPPAG